MRSGLLLLVLTASSAPAQQGAELLLAEANALARATTSWKVEGQRVTKRSNEHFRLTYQISPDAKARFEVLGGDSPILRICDGISQWTYYPEIARHLRAILPQMSACVSWLPPEILLRSPRIVGTSRISFAGAFRECQRVRGAFDVEGTDVEVCIDPTTKLILRYQDSAGTTTLSSIEREVKLDPEIFVFGLPPGSQMLASITWKESVSRGVTAPALLNLVPPRVDVPRISPGGVVTLSMDVNREGVPENIAVIRSAGPGLEDRAVEAVRQWRFEPGTVDGKPVTMTTELALILPAQ